MILWSFVGGEFVDPMIADSVVNFDFSLFAKNQTDAEDAFHEIFPSCFIVSISSRKI